MKKKVVAILLGLNIFTLTACGILATGTETAGTKNPSQVEDLAGDEGSKDEITADDDAAAETGATDDTKENNKEESSYKLKKATKKYSEDEIEERIESAGKAYDGIVSRDGMSVDSILLESSIMSISKDAFSADTRAEKAEVEEYMDLVEEFRSYFRQIKVYEPKDGYTIAISGKKLYEYRISDTDDIIAAYEKAERTRPSMADMDYEDTWANGVSGSRSILSGITNFISGSKSANKTYEAAAECTEAAVCYDAEESCDAAVGDDLAGAPMDQVMPGAVYAEPDWNTEEYKSFAENRFMSVQSSPFSTFGMDVDTASYSNFRKKIFNGRDIPSDSIRTEEMMNYFDYNYADPEDGEKFGVTAEISDTPWNPDTKLLRIGVKSEEADTDDVSTNVVFLIDTSGSMFDADKLPLVQKSFLMLLHNLDRNDKVSIVTYAGGDEVICKGVSCDKKEQITKYILSLEAWGGTNGSAGIRTAYQLAGNNFIKDGNNRVILATDGDLNLGLTSESDLVDLITREKESGVFLSVLGVGSGNYKDSKMKALADNGNGNFAYIDSTASANKALMQDFNSLMYTVAKDAKMQVEFNPAKIKGYRQIGYELRALNAEDFADDTKDGAEIGSGQCVTVLYEIVPSDSDMEIPGVTSKYGNGSAGDDSTGELLTVSIRYKEPDADKSSLMEVAVTDKDYSPEMSDDMSWAAGVAEVSQILRDSEYKGTSDYDEVYDRLKTDSRIMEDENRAQFMYMIKLLENGNMRITDDDYDYYW